MSEERDTMNTASGFYNTLRNELDYSAFKSKLLENATPEAVSSVGRVLDRQRDICLEEAANVGASAATHGWSVLSFPILTDIYATPIISQVMNTFPTSSPTLSIPRTRITATVNEYGTGSRQMTIPTHSGTTKPSFVNAVATPGITNLFTLATTAAGATISASEFKLNRRYTIINSIKVTDSTAGTALVVDTPCVLRPDSRDHFSGDIVVACSASGADAGKVVTMRVSASINYDTGDFTLNGVVVAAATTATLTYTLTSANVQLRFIPVNTSKGRTTVKVTNEMTDITIDQNNDFMIELTQEELQDYQSIFRVDLARTLSEAIKRQILLETDYDLAYFMSAAEPEMAARATLDMSRFTSSSFASSVANNVITPRSIRDVAEAVVPMISRMMSELYKVRLMYPSYLVCGLKTASLLRSIQEFLVNFAAAEGSFGWSGESAQFLKIKILESYAIDAVNTNSDKMYFVCKAPDSALERASIINFVYNPLYVVSEVTDGQQRNFVRSRTLVEVARPDGLACLTLTNLGKIWGDAVVTYNA